MPQPLDPILQWAIANGAMSEAQARDCDAFADGVVARMREGELTEEQAAELVAATAIRDAQAVNRARARMAAAGGNRAARRAQAAEQRKRR